LESFVKRIDVYVDRIVVCYRYAIIEEVTSEYFDRKEGIDMVTKVVECKIIGFDSLLFEKEDVTENAKKDNKKAKEAWKRNIEMIDQAVRDFVAAKNRAITYLFTEYIKVRDAMATSGESSFSSVWKKMHDEKGRSKAMYHYLVKALPGYLTGNVSEGSRRLEKRFDQAVKDGLLYGRVSLPSFRDNAALDFRGDSVKIKQEIIKGEEKLYVELNLKRGIKLHCNIGFSGNKGAKAVAERIGKGEYKAGTASIVKRKSRYFIQICYRFDSDIYMRSNGMAGLAEGLDPKRTLGVDLGLARPVAMQPYDSDSRKYLSGGKNDEFVNTERYTNRFTISGDRIAAFRKQVEKKKSVLQRDLRDVSPGHTGKGRIKRIKPVETFKDRIANFRKTTNFVYAKRIVDTAIKYHCGTIRIEDLTIDVSSRKSERFLKTDWTYYDLQQKIESRAVNFGIVVQKVAPQYTSQKCSKCGHVSADNRKDQSHFKCVSCGFEMNADLNAARNIAALSPNDKIKKEKNKEAKDGQMQLEFILN